MFLLELAAVAGITTIGVGRQAMHEQMLRLGAASCIDYTHEDVAERAVALAGGPVDAIADLVGGTLGSAALRALRPGGQIAAIATPVLDLDAVLDANISFHGVLIQDDGERTRALAACWAPARCGRSSATCSRWRRPLKRTGSWRSRHPGGKIILDLAGS